MTTRNQHGIHLRLDDTLYDFVNFLEDYLNTTKSGAIRQVLWMLMNDENIYDLFKREMKNRVSKDHFECNLAPESKQKLSAFVEIINQNTQQLRKIGTYLSTLIMDIERNNTFYSNIDHLESLSKKCESALNQHVLIAEVLFNLLNSLEIQVVEKNKNY